jgi:hypothetical protein
MTKFATWWNTEGSGMRPLPNEDIEEFTKRVTDIAWSNGEEVKREALSGKILGAFPLFDDDGLDEEKHHCEWTLQQDRKRLHAMLGATPVRKLVEPVQEPSYLDVQLAEQIMSDCGCSTNNQRLLERITARLGNHKVPAAQPVPVKTCHDGWPWPVAPKPWVELTDTEVSILSAALGFDPDAKVVIREAEAKLKEKNT